MSVQGAEMVTSTGRRTRQHIGPDAFGSVGAPMQGGWTGRVQASCVVAVGTSPAGRRQSDLVAVFASLINSAVGVSRAGGLFFRPLAIGEGLGGASWSPRARVLTAAERRPHCHVQRQGKPR